jgi:hypothetical protein
MAWKVKTKWDCEQWGRLADEMNMRKEKIEVIRRGMSVLARQTKECRAHQTPATAPPPLASTLLPPPPLAQVPEQDLRPVQDRTLMLDPTPALQLQAPRSLTPPAPGTAPEVVMVDVKEDEIEEFSDLKGVQREGLYDSTHLPPPGEPDYIVHSGTGRMKKSTWQDSAKARMKKGKVKKVVGVTRERTPVKGQPTEILKRAEALEKEMVRNMTRWEAGNFGVTETEGYCDTQCTGDTPGHAVTMTHN